ncbi:Acyl-CoA N-acyltransferases (Nat) [Glarea lozoyensis ATCC 20868]|uniref:Acyl-CoA N-acyltransferases (Nat) n=1 Tax=Glarea lozoyensis (strain ATCC 20868 / MF5171) TaxID=1116229 RepID=S3DJU0_GLAL2|nr:Acyl-CoA N-acyltransferases (Nat) [Glarea lozoyensis ATCC 20868]EPE32296.1 Acyl-CoA N-acyltransferases (Nat) [Glarea lozoyensis ATCC 20868]
MRVNQGVAVSLKDKVLLVPYESRHVERYHEWMSDPLLQEQTSSLPLTHPDEYAMQKSWRVDRDKLTFIICLPLTTIPSLTPISTADETTTGQVRSGEVDTPERMVGDVNMFLSDDDENDERVLGELEIMIAEKEMRGKGFARSALVTFIHFIRTHVSDILLEYSTPSSPTITTSSNPIPATIPPRNKLTLHAKISQENTASLALFESFGFCKTREEVSYFGEWDVRLEGFGEGGVSEIEALAVGDGYQELRYVEA